MAKKAKVAKTAKAALPRPTTSPYTSPPVTLYFGPTRQIYYLPEVLLQKLENTPSRDPRTGEIHLVDVDASIGHVLMHFLHTGAYQTLNEGGVVSIENTHSSIVRNEFQKAVLVLEAAKKYSVPGLQELAQIELERQGKDMYLRDAVRAIREDFIAGPPDEHAWLRDYVSKKVRWTFEHDPPTLYAPDFFESIESPTLTRLLAQTIVGLYSEEVDKLRKGKTATGKISTSERSEPPGSSSPGLPRSAPKRITEIPTTWPASVEKFGAFDDSVAAWDPHNLGQDQGSKPAASAPAALSSTSKEEKEEGILHTIEEHAEASADNLQNTQPETVPSSADQATEHDTTAVEGLKQPREEKTASSSTTAVPLSPVNPPAGELLSSESAVKDIEASEKPASINMKKKKKKLIVPPAQSPSKDPLAGLSKMQKKKLEKKMQEEAAVKEKEDAELTKSEKGIAEIQHLQAEQLTIAQTQERGVAAASSTATKDDAEKFEEEAMWDSWGALPGITKKKKKAKKGVTPGPPPSPPHLMTPPPPASPPDMQFEVDLTPVIADVAAVAAILPAAQEDPKAEVDPYAGLSKSEAKKEKGRLEEEAKRQKEKEDADEILRQEEEEAERIRLKEEECLVKEEEERLQKEEEERLQKEEEERLQKEEEERLIKEAEEEADRKEKEEEEAAAAAAAEPSILSATSGLSWGQEPASNTDDWASFGATSVFGGKKKKKKGKKSERVRLEEEEAERIRLEKEEKEAAATATAAEAGVSVFETTIETGATSNDDDCELRLEHLSRDDGWQNCKPCELYMRKIALKLHSVGLLNVNGFSTTNRLG